MKKLFSVIFAAAMFIFVACEQKTETVSEETTTPVEETQPAADEAGEVEPISEQPADTAAQLEDAAEQNAEDTQEESVQE